MLESKKNISNKVTAFIGATVAVASVFAYSIIIIIYAIIRSSAAIYSIMPIGERNSILWANSISVAYSVAIFSIIQALISSISGAIAAVILKNLLLYFNPKLIFKKTVFISCITAFALLIFLYVLLYGLLKDWMTFNYFETFSFWFLFPAAIFFSACVIGGIKLNKVLNTRMVTSSTPTGRKIT